MTDLVATGQESYLLHTKDQSFERHRRNPDPGLQQVNLVLPEVIMLRREIRRPGTYIPDKKFVHRDIYISVCSVGQTSVGRAFRSARNSFIVAYRFFLS
jgi:hypothetical protein